MMRCDARVEPPAMKSLPPVPALALALLVFGAPSTRAKDDCDAPAESWQPRSAVNALAQRQGWEVERLKIEDGC